MPGALADLVDDAVLAVAAVLRVDVVVAGEPQEPLAAPLPAALGGRRGRGTGLGEDAAGRETGTEQAGAPQQGAARTLLGGQRVVGTDVSKAAGRGAVSWCP